MTVMEAMRRLGILLGACGAILGGLVAYRDAKAVWTSYAASRRFESLMASPTMRKVAQAALDYERKYWKDPWAKYRSPGMLTYQDGAIWADVPSPSLERAGHTEIEIRRTTPVEPPTRRRESRDIWIWDQAADSFVPDHPVPISVNLEGIREVAAEKTGVISSIELATGESVQRTVAPRVTAYFRLLLYPLFGFMLPWATFRALAWVARGLLVRNRE
jgi:hypothetical protein